MLTPALCVLDVKESFIWGDDLINTQFKPSGCPIFIVDLQMDEEKVFYSRDPEKFEVNVNSLSSIRQRHLEINFRMKK